MTALRRAKLLGFLYENPGSTAFDVPRHLRGELRAAELDGKVCWSQYQGDQPRWYIRTTKETKK